MCGATVEVAAAAHIAQVNSLPRLRVPHAILPRVLPSAHLRLRGDAELVLDHSAGSRVLSSERGQVGGEGTREGDKSAKHLFPRNLEVPSVSQERFMKPSK